MNDTPRTNHMLTAILETHGHVGFLNCPPAWVAFARELERELNAANQRIKRLEEVGERLWVKARNISIEDTYDRHGNEVAVQELNPETVVLDYDHGDGITAGNMVELLEALKEWKKAKEAKP